jgi:hypothetical protein
MATYRDVCYDIFTILRGNFDDTEITLNHVLYWVQVYGDRLRIQHDEKIDSGSTISVFNALPVLTEANTGRKYIEIPSGIYDKDGDSGIVYLSYSYSVDPNAFSYVTFSRTQPSYVQRLYWTNDERPAPDNPYFYRIGNRVYLLGLECIDVNFIEAGLKTTLVAEICDLDDEFVFPPELIPILQRQVLDLGRFVLQIPADRTNDSDYSLQNQEIPKTKIISTASITAPVQQEATNQQEPV